MNINQIQPTLIEQFETLSSNLGDPFLLTKTKTAPIVAFLLQNEQSIVDSAPLIERVVTVLSKVGRLSGPEISGAFSRTVMILIRRAKDILRADLIDRIAQEANEQTEIVARAAPAITALTQIVVTYPERVESEGATPSKEIQAWWEEHFPLLESSEYAAIQAARVLILGATKLSSKEAMRSLALASHLIELSEPGSPLFLMASEWHKNIKKRIS